jgi:hypothetical protein
MGTQTLNRPNFSTDFFLSGLDFFKLGLDTGKLSAVSNTVTGFLLIHHYTLRRTDEIFKVR